jgi:hypothetical protein
MSKYYRECKPTECGVLYFDHYSEHGYYVPVEIDEWHPASEPPKPEDFEPTGNVECLEKLSVRSLDGRIFNAFTHWKNDSWTAEAAPFCTHWRKITPPK